MIPLFMRLDTIYSCLAWLLPRRLVYYAALRLFVSATTGKHSDQSPTDLRAMDALIRWLE